MSLRLINLSGSFYTQSTWYQYNEKYPSLAKLKQDLFMIFTLSLSVNTNAKHSLFYLFVTATTSRSATPCVFTLDLLKSIGEKIIPKHVHLIKKYYTINHS